MNSRAVATENRLTQWACAIKERNEHGESINEFCKRRGISRNTYFYWQKKLREVACRQLEALQSPAAETGLSATRFAEVTLLAPPAQQSRPVQKGEEQLSIEVAGVRITAHSEYPADKLAALVLALMRPC